jgi:uncharacterized membrane protein YeaQ/YmgE (transglycosylase-associated protein family)
MTGIAGAFIGGIVAWFLPILHIFWSIPAAFVGAVILLLILKANSARAVR